MKKLLLSVSLMAVALIGSAQFNDKMAQKVDVTSFHSVSVSNVFDVFLTQGGEDALAISASTEEYRDKIRTKVENGVLKIWYDNDKKFWKGASGKMDLKVYISFREIKKISLSGACDATIVGELRTENLKLDLSGASDLEGKVSVSELVVDLSGASDMKLTGTAGKLKVDISGASEFSAIDLESDYCDIDASGASSARVTANKELKAEASGASDIVYKGDADVQKIKSSGGGSIKKRS